MTALDQPEDWLTPTLIGGPLADYECEHGRLAGDRTPACGCWTQEPRLQLPATPDLLVALQPPPRNRGGRPRRVLPDEVVTEAWARHQAGESIVQLSRLLLDRTTSVSAESLRVLLLHRLKERGWQPRTRGEAARLHAARG